MRTFPFAVPTALGIHANITITQPDGELRVTTAPSDVTIGGFTWIAQGAVNITQIQYSADGSPSAADVRIASNSDGPIRPGMAARGLLDALPIKVELFDLADPSTGTYDMIPGANVGSVAEDTNGVIVIAVQGRLSLLKAPMCEVHTTVCRARLGDSRCRVPIIVDDVGRGIEYVLKSQMEMATAVKWGASQCWVRKLEGGIYNDVVYECTTAGITHASVAPTYPTVIDATVTDGTCVFTARQAFLVAATGEALDFFNIQLDADPSYEPTPLGNLIPRDGPLTNTKLPIAAYDSYTRIVTLFEPYAISNFPTGTTFEVHPGCDRILDTCRDTFDNVPNFRGAPYAPSSDLANARA